MIGFTLSDKQYNFAKWLVQIFLPALGVLYFTLSSLLGFPGGETVVAALAAVALFIGTVLGISTKNYEEHTDGEIIKEYNPETGKTILGLELNEEASVIGSKDRVVFSVVDKNGPFWVEKP